MFDNEELGFNPQSLLQEVKNDKKSKSKIKSLQNQDDEDDGFDENQNINVESLKLPNYLKIADMGFVDKIINLFHASKLPHFVIVHGKAGIGKCYGINIAISKIFESINFICDLTQEVNQNNNPDVLYIRNIKKDEKEDLKNLTKNFINLKDDVDLKIKPFVQKTSLMNGPKFIVIDNIDNLSKSVANSILKILEEAGSSLYVIALSHDIKRVLKTIVSRGIVFNVSPPCIEDFTKILTIQNISCDNIKQIYNISGFSVFLSKILIQNQYDKILININKNLQNMQNFKIDDISEINIFCTVLEFALKDLMIARSKFTNNICNTLNYIQHILNDYLKYNTTLDLTKILIINEINKLIIAMSI